MRPRFPGRAAALALVGTVVLALAGLLIDSWIGLPDPFDRVVRSTGVVPLFAICLLCALAGSKPGRAWLADRVPPISAAALGLFRVAFAASLALVVRSTVSEPASRTLCLVCLGLFAIGLAARVSFVLFVLVFTRVHLGETDDHAVALPLKTLWLMMIVPWGAGAGVDAWLRGRFGRPPGTAPSRAYGLATWIPVLMLGLAYAAAAFAKMDEVGPRWITGGAVKYFFLADAHRAPVPWGRLIARSDTLSVLLSGGAVAGEASIILAAIWPSTAMVCAAGIVALSLQAGFYLFQGVWWPAWWALLPAFLPWQPIASATQRMLGRPEGEGSRSMAAAGQLPWIVGVVLILAVLQQPIASLLRRTYSFLLSDFPMYSNVYFASRAEVAAQQEAVFQPPPMIRFQPAGGTPDGGIDARLRDIDRGDVLSTVARKVAGGQPITEADAASVRDVTARYVSKFGSVPLQIDVMADTWRFDWSTADFAPREQWKKIATVDLDDGAIEVRQP
jgi:hypothetical protein